MSVSTQELGPLPSRSDNIDFVREFYAKRILALSLKNYDNQINGEVEKSRFSAPPLQATDAEESTPDIGVHTFSYQTVAPKLPELGGSSEFTIGILGAGVAGLYTALMIDSLGPDSGITYQILEANERIGGRLYTHIFKGDKTTPDDYYVGPSS